MFASSSTQYAPCKTFELRERLHGLGMMGKHMAKVCKNMENERVNS